jgi:hypothetical protein
MGFFTRKNNKNNALKEAFTVQQRAAYNLEHKHSKVGNVLSSPGKIKSLNAERIKKNADEKIDNIARKYRVDIDELHRDLQKEKMEPTKLVESAKELKEMVEKEMKTNDGKITITLNHSLAKILIFILNVVIFFIVSMLGVFQLVLILLSSATGTTSSSSETGKFWDWILKGKWIISMSSLNGDKNSMKYYNNPLHR